SAEPDVRRLHAGAARVRAHDVGCRPQRPQQDGVQGRRHPHDRRRGPQHHARAGLQRARHGIPVRRQRHAARPRRPRLGRQLYPAPGEGHQGRPARHDGSALRPAVAAPVPGQLLRLDQR
ncbi:hypothetical protein BN1708_019674, partial [Verticillium longisporum]